MAKPFAISALAAATAVLAAAGAAYAGPGADLARDAVQIQAEAGLRADALSRQPGAAAQAPDPDDDLIYAIEQFSADALRLSRFIDASGGSADLGCIFRGMSADAEARLNALIDAERASEQARVWRAIALLMEDAAVIAPDADAETDAGAEETANAPPLACPAADPG